MTEYTNSLTLKSIKSEVEHILTPAKLGLTTNELIKDYLDFNAEQTFPNRDYGYANPDDFLKSIHFKDILEFKNGKWHALDNEKTRHIRKMVKGQRTSKNTISRKEPFRQQNVQNRNQNYMYKKKINNYNEYSNLDGYLTSIKERQDQENQIKTSTSSSQIITPSYTKNPLLTKHDQRNAQPIPIPNPIPKQLSHSELLEFKTIEQKIYRILKSEKGLVTGHTLHKRFQDIMGDAKYPKQYRLEGEPQPHLGPIGFIKSFGRNVIKESHFIEGNNGNLLPLTEDAALERVLSGLPTVQRFVLHENFASIKPNLSNVITKNITNSEQMRLESKIIKIIRSESVYAWASQLTLVRRFQTSTCNSRYFKDRKMSSRQFFEYYGKNVVKMVRFCENKDGYLVKKPNKEEEAPYGILDHENFNVNNSRPRKIFERWVLLEDFSS